LINASMSTPFDRSSIGPECHRQTGGLPPDACRISVPSRAFRFLLKRPDRAGCISAITDHI
jgi:hypothetical protein